MLPSNSSKGLDSIKVWTLDMGGVPGEIFYSQKVTLNLHICGFYSLWSLRFMFVLVMAKGLSQSSLESLKILRRNAGVSLLVSSDWQCYCGYCCSDMCVKLCLETLKLILQPSCFQMPMMSACHSTTACRSHV